MKLCWPAHYLRYETKVLHLHPQKDNYGSQTLQHTCEVRQLCSLAPSWDVSWREIDPTLIVSGNNTSVSSHSLCSSKSAENPMVIHKVPLYDIIVGVCYDYNWYYWTPFMSF